MAIMDFKIPTSNQTRNNNTRSDRPKAKLWVNVGYHHNGKFVNLPLGMPIDTMEPEKVRGSNEDWLKLTAARNALLEALKAHGFNLEPGQEVEIPNLTIMLRRVNEQTEIAAENNKYAVDLAALFAGAGNQQQAAE